MTYQLAVLNQAGVRPGQLLQLLHDPVERPRGRDPVACGARPASIADVPLRCRSHRCHALSADHRRRVRAPSRGPPGGAADDDPVGRLRPHKLMPAVIVIDLLLTLQHHLPLGVAFAWLAYPLAWFAFTLIRGAGSTGAPVSLRRRRDATLWPRPRQQDRDGRRDGARRPCARMARESEGGAVNASSAGRRLAAKPFGEAVQRCLGARRTASADRRDAGGMGCSASTT
jgi:hypothetical protein